jgi:hypothetical protein
MDGACCKEPYPDRTGRCMGCGGAHKPGQEAYEVSIELPNGTPFRDPQVQEHLSQVVPHEWPGFTARLEQSDRDSSDDTNKYKLRLFRRNEVPAAQPAFANMVLAPLVKVADRLDAIRAHDEAGVIDEIIRSVTAEAESGECTSCGEETYGQKLCPACSKRDFEEAGMSTEASRKTANCQGCAAYEEGIRDLTSYLTSSKFHEDTTVQTADVLTRLSEIGSSAWQAPDSRPSASGS